jgi:hypothetical protein
MPAADRDEEICCVSPPPCGEGLGVGVSKQCFRCGTRTPDPSPQGGGAQQAARRKSDEKGDAALLIDGGPTIGRSSTGSCGSMMSAAIEKTGKKERGLSFSRRSSPEICNFVRPKTKGRARPPKEARGMPGVR